MGSGIFKRQKSKNDVYRVDDSDSLDDREAKIEDRKNRMKQSKEGKDSTLAGGDDAKVKTKKEKKEKKPKKSDKKEKDDKKKKGKGSKDKSSQKTVQIEVTAPDRPGNVYQGETSTSSQNVQDSSPQLYLSGKIVEQRTSADLNDSEYSSLYEGEDKRTSRQGPLYENEAQIKESENDCEYVIPDNMPDLPPKRNKQPPLTEREPMKLPGSTPEYRASGEYEIANKGEVDTSEETVEIDSDSLYCDTETPVQQPVKKPEPPPRPPGDESPGVKVVVAIDFGTTFTGYAYSYVEDKDTIHMNPNWASGRSASFKTPTWVSLDKYNELHAFGFEAQSAYNEESESTQEATVSLYKEFKLQLMKKSSSDDVVVLKSEYGEDVPALNIFGAAMKFLKDKIEQRFKDAGKVFRPWQICWVLTVPAIWDDAQKLFMKEAAKKAGLIRNVDDKHLLIALEPEAASLYCRTLKMNNFKGGRGEETVRLSPGTVYIVLDAGGGTIDITVHKVLEKNQIAEIYQANGGPWGGSKINGSFETKLKGILGEEFVKHCQKDNPAVWLDLILEFEQAKQSDAARPNSEKPLTLTIGLGLMNCYSEFTGGESLPTAINRHKDSGLKINKQGKLEVSPDNVMSMFSSVVRKTIDHMRNILQKPEISKASVIFIVGGFGQCPYLQDEVRKHFLDRDRNVLIPTEGNLCVVKGAVMFGHQPDFMSSRIARYTYAYLDSRLHNANTDGERDTVETDNGDRVVLCLTPIIRKGEIVGHTEERTKDFDVVTEEFKLSIYCSENETVDDPEAKDVIQMGELHISIPSSKRESKVGTAEKVKVTFTLSTELKVKGTHLASNTTTETLLPMKTGKKKQQPRPS